MSTAPARPIADDAVPSSGHDVPLLDVDDVHVDFTVGRRRLQAVRGVSLVVGDGETVAVVGESGCGKSTLAKTICGLYPPVRGRVRFRGIDVHTARGQQAQQVRSDLQLLFQEPLPSLNPRLTVRRILWEPMKAIGLSRRIGDADERIRKELASVGLPEDAADGYPRDFSGGQQQRIALARLLVLRPSLICADEPVSALDVSVQAQIIGLMRRLQQEQHLAYLLISHDLPLVAQTASRVAVMYLGEVVESGPAAQVVTEPLHPYTTALRSATPLARPSALQRERIVLQGEPPSPLDPPSGCSFHPRCPIARPRCAKEKPPLMKQADGRLAACFYAGELQ